MDFKLFLEMAAPRKIGYDEAKARGMFFPVYHGTTEENQEKINQDGFKVVIGGARTDITRHGYEAESYGYTGILPPVHHIGYGTYFTTVKSIAKDYGAKKLIAYALDVPKLETINFASSNRMMAWWQKNGYNMKQISTNLIPKDIVEKLRIVATENMTNQLKAKYDAVWFKGKTLYRTLDGDQICVYDPSKIYVLDNELTKRTPMSDSVEARIGDRFVIKDTKATAKIKNIRPTNGREDSWTYAVGPYDHYLEIGEIKNWDDVVKVYEPKLSLALDHMYANKIGYVAHRLNGLSANGKTIEQDKKEHVDYLLGRYTHLNGKWPSTHLNFPSCLIGRILKPGERVK